MWCSRAAPPDEDFCDALCANAWAYDRELIRNREDVSGVHHVRGPAFQGGQRLNLQNEA